MRTRILTAALLIAAGPAFAAAPDAATQIPPDGRGVAAAKTIKAARLNELFAKLQTLTDPADAKAVERAIVVEWLRSGDDKADEVMLQAMIAMTNHQFAVALGYLNALCASRPDYVEAWNKRATIYFYMNDYERSLADIDKTLALEPRHFGALAGLGMIRQNQGDKKAALEAYERAFAVDPLLANVKQVIEILRAELRGI